MCASIAVGVIIAFFHFHAKQSSLLYTFSTMERLEEAGSEEESNSPYFWLDSGGYMDIENGVGKTIQGETSMDNTWRGEYAISNATDTDTGAHPQNIFRLISKSLWKNVREEVYFKILKDNLSQSPNRDESNGLLLFMRYIDSNNLYYVGVRVDGHSIIKKKLNGVYYLLDERPLFPGKTYNRDTVPNLLPKNTWIGIRGEIRNVGKNVFIQVYTDVGNTGIWTLAAEAQDDGLQNKNVIKDAGHGGIRTDFMDVYFDGYRLENI